ncbi:MAG: DUF58 domain-containing protein [Armatimonadetes bacterium]|nr:DUF58 domain-containing protein [Armatimonadota bacterium]
MTPEAGRKVIGSTLLDAELIQTLERLRLVSRRRLPGQLAGDRKSPRRGSGVEFADFREYAPGDDFRRVDWNLYARSEKLFLKLFSLDEDRTLSILIDCTRSMDTGDPSKELYARKLAAALGYVGLAGMDRVKLYPLGAEQSRPIGPLRGRAHTHRMLKWLDDLKCDGRGELGAAIQTFLASEKTPGVAILLSDFLEEEVWTELRGFGVRRFDTTAVQVLSPEDVRPVLTGDLRLLDSESEQSLDVSITASLIRDYQKALSRLQANLRDECLRSGLSFLTVQTDMAIMDIFGRMLRGRGTVS